MLIPLVVSCLVIGVLIGATGIGGVLLIPALMAFGGLGTHQAMATALCTFFFLGFAATWTYHRYGSLDWKMALPVMAGAFPCSYAGAWLSAQLPGPFLNLLLAAIIICSSLYSMLPVGRATLAQRLSPRGNLCLLFGIGLFTGFLCGMTGAGGGVVSIPVMLICGYAALPTIGTGQTLLTLISLSGSASNYANDFIVFSHVWWVTLCQLAGLALGARIAHAVPVALLKKGVSLLSLAVGLLMVAQTLLS